MRYDVLIVGGGVVGSALALSLIRQGMHVGLVETNPSTELDLADFDSKVYAINPASEHIFRNLGIWDSIISNRISKFIKMVIWDDNYTNALHFDAVNVASHRLGYIVEHKVLLASLHNKLFSYQGFDFISPDSLKSFDMNEDEVVVYLESGKKISSELLVGADGSHSKTRDLAGILFEKHDYGQKAIVANIKLEKLQIGTAWQRFTSSGILALLPLDDEHCSIVLSTKIADRLLSLSDREFCQYLQDMLQNQLHIHSLISNRVTFPLYGASAKNYIKDKVVLVGDAAHIIHPLAGQGVNLGLMDIAVFSEIIDSRKNGYLHNRYLRAYERARKGENLMSKLTMEGFQWMFLNENSFLKTFRNAGFAWVNNQDFLKKRIIKHASGLSGIRPKIASSF
ncbi:MAG: FAD-dependent monooxygenase [Pseudomonadota bacterium]